MKHTRDSIWWNSSLSCLQLQWSSHHCWSLRLVLTVVNDPQCNWTRRSHCSTHQPQAVVLLVAYVIAVKTYWNQASRTILDKVTSLIATKTTPFSWQLSLWVLPHLARCPWPWWPPNYESLVLGLFSWPTAFWICSGSGFNQSCNSISRSRALAIMSFSFVHLKSS